MRASPCDLRPLITKTKLKMPPHEKMAIHPSSLSFLFAPYLLKARAQKANAEIHACDVPCVECYGHGNVLIHARNKSLFSYGATHDLVMNVQMDKTKTQTQTNILPSYTYTNFLDLDTEQ